MFHGGAYSAATGLYQFRARWYSPELGRWLSPDPIGLEGGLNLYEFCGNDPVNLRDPWGLWIEDAVIGVPSLAMGAMSFADSVRGGDALGATIDAIGMAADVVAIAIPGIPGGAGMSIKAARLAKNLNRADRVANAARNAANALDQIQDALEDGIDSCDLSDKLNDAAKRAMLQAALGGASKKLGAVSNRLPSNRISAPPSKRGKAPIGDDGYPVELHHHGQQNNSSLDEMTRTDHRLGDNYSRNHSNTGQELSDVDRAQARREQRQHWANEYDAGRFSSN